MRIAVRPVAAIASGAALCLVVLGTVGCSLDGLLNSDELPPNLTDPAITQTANGALAAYNGTIAGFGGALNGFAVGTGLLSDELRLKSGDQLDQRVLPEGTTSGRDTYAALQRVRNQAGQAIGLLTRYRPADAALAGRLYAVQGYTELFLAELYCSGIPLSTLDYAGDFTYRPGSSTTEVLTHAIALFDTALTLAADSARFVDFARIGRARALVALGGDSGYAAAAAAVGSVASDYHSGTQANFAKLTNSGASAPRVRDWLWTVPDREGTNGLDWRSSGDPRTGVRVDSSETSSGSYAYTYHPLKYNISGSTPIVVASGVEARLIEAEAALQAGEVTAWREKLNQLRRMAPTIDPAWPVLADTTDPGTAGGRVDLLFRERAFWLFLTGHRQGDLRRLIRQYGRTQNQVYPVGTYGADNLGIVQLYGSDVDVPTGERNNPLYAGCASRGA